MSKVLRAFAIQLGVFAILTVGVSLMPHLIHPPYPIWGLVLIQAVLAASVSCKLGLPCWWRWIQFLIPWGLFIAFELEVNPWIGLAAFVVLWLVFANASKERVPLYLTNTTTRQALSALIEQQFVQKHTSDDSDDYDQTQPNVRDGELHQPKPVCFMDLGCGLGGNVVFMAQQPEVEFSTGVETAPIPYLLARLFSRLKGGEVLAQDLWKTSLRDYNFVYAFLSTEPMPRLWQKIQAEMQPGSVFVSNSFAVPDIDPSEIWELSDPRQTRLFIYYL